MRFLLSTAIVVLLFVTSCASLKHKNVAYLDTETVTALNGTSVPAPTLNVFQPKNASVKTPVLIYVHGGNWNKGKKEIYWWLGRNFAKKDVLAILPGYTLSPSASYDEMATQIAQAIEWTKENASAYGGDPAQIYLTGHSAGGHLAALSVMNPKYGINPDDIKGIILNDAAGLDMHHYLESNPPREDNNYKTTWSTDPENWKDASPIYFLNENTPPFMIYLGSKTYNSITVANKRFKDALQEFQPEVSPIILDKKHVPMITQYIFGWSDRYDEILNFMENNK